MDDSYEPEPPDPSGELTLTAEFLCGACDISPTAWLIARVETRAEAVKMARNRGWRLTKWDGWICPECAKRSRKKGSKTDA